MLKNNNTVILSAAEGFLIDGEYKEILRLAALTQDDMNLTQDDMS